MKIHEAPDGTVFIVTEKWSQIESVTTGSMHSHIMEN